METGKESNTESLRRQVQWLNLGGIALLCLILGAGFFLLVRFFLVPVILAATLTTLFYPFFKWILKRSFRRSRALASILCCLILVSGIFVPLYLIVHVVALQTIDLYRSSETWAKKQLTDPDPIIPQAVKEHRLYRQLHLDEIRLQDIIREVINSSGKLVSLVVNKTSAGAFELLAGAFLTIFTLFYFFRDGERLLERLRQLSPLRPRYEDMILSRFVLIARATIKGTVIIGLIQGLLGGVLLLVLGFKMWLLWGVIMIVLSILPIVGSYFVLAPAALVLFWEGRIGAGIATLIVATVLNYGVDYLLRPRLVGHDSKAHDLIILFSTLGGLAVFGVMGFVIGPVIAMLFITMVEIYASEFRQQLEVANEETVTQENAT